MAKQHRLDDEPPGHRSALEVHRTLNPSLAVREICEQYGDRSLLQPSDDVDDTEAAQEDRWIAYALDARRKYRRANGLPVA